MARCSKISIKKWSKGCY